jgi:SAM-dependent methyltransferase
MSLALFAEPREVKDPGQCIFYHTIDVPGHGCLRGEWDLRAGIDEYLGRVDFAGKTVLDVGAATGFLSFTMEQRGADVVSYDLNPRYRWDLVPLGNMRWREDLEQAARNIARINNGYWFCHRAFGSKARVVNGTVYTMPAAIGQRDIVTVGSILCHLRDPMLALHNAVRLARDTVIVVDTVPRRRFLRWCLAKVFGNGAGRFFPPTLNFLPRFEKGVPYAVWWDVSPAFTRQCLGLLGFEETHTTFHHQYFQGTPKLLWTIVARRTKETPPLEMYEAAPAQAA